MRMTCGKGGKWWEVSPTLINSGMRIKRENEEKKRESTKRGRKRIERERNGEKKKNIFPAFRRSNLDGPRVKFDPHNKGYTWVPKFGSFVKLQEIENFPILIIFSLKVI